MPTAVACPQLSSPATRPGFTARQSILAACIVFAALVPVRAEEAAPLDPPTAWEVYLILEKSCSECHGGHLTKPKGSLGYILDFRRLIEKAYITPGSPEVSDLYTALIDEDPDVRMPPPDSDGPKPTAEQIEHIRAWIAAGARIDPETVDGPEEAAVGARSAPPPPSRSLGRFAGRLHPVLVHFPIAMLICAGIAKLGGRLRGSVECCDGLVRASLWIGALGAAASAGCGWLNAMHEGFSGGVVETHRWLGISTTAVALVTLALNEFLLRRNSPSRHTIVLIALLAATILVALAGHTGGLLSYGQEYFDIF